MRKFQQGGKAGETSASEAINPKVVTNNHRFLKRWDCSPCVGDYYTGERKVFQKLFHQFQGCSGENWIYWKEGEVFLPIAF